MGHVGRSRCIGRAKVVGNKTAILRKKLYSRGKASVK